MLYNVPLASSKGGAPSPFNLGLRETGLCPLQSLEPKYLHQTHTRKKSDLQTSWLSNRIYMGTAYTISEKKKMSVSHTELTCAHFKMVFANSRAGDPNRANFLRMIYWKPGTEGRLNSEHLGKSFISDS